VFLAFSLKEDANYKSHCADLNDHHKQCSRSPKFSFHALWPAI